MTDFDPQLEIDSVTLNNWSQKTVEELEAMRDQLYQRVDRFQEFSESIQPTFDRMELLEQYIAYRKGQPYDKRTVIL